MKYYTDKELIDGFSTENLTENQKEIFLDRAQHSEFVRKFMKKLDELAG